MNSKYVSIIIPTYNDWQRLFVCIEALQNQTYPKEMFEVIIINNNPADKIPADFLLPPNYKLLNEEKPGSYAARNAGLKIARGEIIGFTDSDCIPDKDWIRNAIAYLATNASCSRIAGHISIIYKSVKPTLTELYNTLYAFPQKWHVEKVGTSVTANLFTYRYLFERVGYFDDKLLSMGDSRWALLAGKAGYQLNYVENVIVNHPARSFSELVKKEKRLGGAEGTFRKKSASKLKNVYVFLHSLRPHKREYKFLSYQGKNLNKADKAFVFIMRNYLMGIRGYERLRVQIGKKPNRA